MAGRFAGKVALVVGGSSGIGGATVVAFAREGAKVVLAGIHDEAGTALANKINAAGGQACFIPVNVINVGGVEALVQKTVETYGRLDCAINSAGVSGKAVRMTECPEAMWDRVVAVNLKGVWLCMKYELQQMLKQGGGTIVNMASVAGMVGFPQGFSPYVASKHGVVGLTKTAALEYAPNGIRINAVCPSFVHTPMMERLTGGSAKAEESVKARIPLGRIATPEEIAATILWLSSDAASYVTGAAMAVDGGYLAQ